jgi:molecular chaperone GrpE
MAKKTKTQAKHEPSENKAYETMNSAQDKSAELHSKIKELEERMDHSMTEAKKFEDHYLRAVAETENIKRRSEKDVESAHKYAVSSFAKDLIDVLENLYRSTEHVTEEQKADKIFSQVFDGIEMTRNEFVKILKKYGVERVSPKEGDKFDHNYHQAISQQETDKFAPNSVLYVTQAGYVLQDRLIRPALVVVSK